jgi:iron complex transport system ATP-binding protein
VGRPTLNEPPISASGAILEARDLRFHHPGAPRLFDRLSFSLAPGEMVGLIGPNGSGKTTLLRILGGTLAPESGEVLLAGGPIRALPPRDRARFLAVVPQESRILFNFGVLEVVLMGRAPHLGLFGLERPDDYAAARAALRAVDLEGTRHEEQHLNQLSSGERQRALIARALAQEPRLLLLDEPTAFLDLKHRLQIYEILRRLNRDRGLTVLVVSHDLNLAARYATRLLLLHAGHLVADGPPAMVLTPDRIRAVYETEARVDIDPETGTPHVIPLSPTPAPRL